MKLRFLFLLLSVLLMSSCNGGKVKEFFSDDEVEEDSLEAFVGDTLHLFDEEVVPESVDELFIDFFYNFASDNRFQVQRISFPLKCNDGDEVMMLSKEDWKQFNNFESQDFFSVIYEREHDLDLEKDTTIQNVAVEWIYLKDGYVERFSFSRLAGKWMLQDVEKDQISSLPNAGFLNFYADFVEDSVSQRNAINSPLKLVLTPELEGEEEQVEMLSADDWFSMKSDLPMPEDALVNIDYGQTCISQNRKTIFIGGVSNGLQMKYRFNKIGNEWKLIEIDY